MITPARSFSRSRTATRGLTLLISLSLNLPLAGQVLEAPASAASSPSAAPDTRKVICPILADTTVFAGSAEARTAGGGGEDSLTAGQGTRFALLRFDVSELANQEVVKATLRLKRIEDLLVRAGLSTISVGGWYEGSAKPFNAENGAASYSLKRYHQDLRLAFSWAGPGSDFGDVVFGNGGSRWVSVVPNYDKTTKWYEIDVPPAFVQAIVDGIQPGGLCLSDDFGRQDVASKFCSRETEDPADRPQLVVETRRPVATASAPPTDLRIERDAMGLEWLTFSAPAALGFQICLADQPIEDDEDAAFERATKLENWELPTPGGVRTRALLTLRRQAPDRYVSIRALDSGKRWSPFISQELPAPAPRAAQIPFPELKRYPLPDSPQTCFTLDDGPAISRDGLWMRTAAFTWWDPFKGPVSLQSGLSEFTAFQVVLAGPPGVYSVSLADWRGPDGATAAPQSDLFLQHYVKARVGQEKFGPEVAVPLKSGAPLPLFEANTDPSTSQPSSPQRVQGVWIDTYVPRAATPGQWQNRVIVVRDGAVIFDMPIALEVLPVALPDSLGFQVTLNSSEIPATAAGAGPEDARAWELLTAYHRLTHIHRATLALVPYNGEGIVHPGFAPEILRESVSVSLDWAAWNARFGPLLDGSAFRDLPRAGVPLAQFILPFCESWPAPFDALRAVEGTPLAQRYHYRTTWTDARPGVRGGSPAVTSYLRWPIESAAPSQFAEINQSALAQTRTHIESRNWRQTQFELYLNNGIRPGGKGTWFQLRDPLLLDDLLAVRFFLRMYDAVLGPRRELLRTRADLPAPEFQRGVLAGLVDIAVVGESLLTKNFQLLSSATRSPVFWMRLESTDPEFGWAGLLRDCWVARLAGATGVVVRGALGHAKNWDDATTGALVLPPRPDLTGEPCASLRLKALRRGQQDLEWLALWMKSAPNAGIPEGYLLASIGLEVAARGDAKGPRGFTLLPVLQFPGQLDTVVFEEARRALRAAVLQPTASRPTTGKP